MGRALAVVYELILLTHLILILAATVSVIVIPMFWGAGKWIPTFLVISRIQTPLMFSKGKPLDLFREGRIASLRCEVSLSETK